MTQNFIDALDAEIRSQKEAVAVATTRLQELLRVKRLYEAGGAELEDLAPPVRSDVVRRQAAQSVSRRRASERNQQILELAATIIKGRVKPTPTAEILDAVEERNLFVHGQKPKNTLSAMLSNSERFVAHGRSGWTLAEEDEAINNAEAADDPHKGESSTASDSTQPDQLGSTSVRSVNPAPGGGT